jgi:hypothetical protein
VTLRDLLWPQGDAPWPIEQRYKHATVT